MMAAAVKRPKTRRIDDKTRPADRITARDSLLLRLIAEHQVLTSSQIDNALFGCRRTALERIATLRAFGMIETFRPPVSGSSPMHCVVTVKGARLAAEASGDGCIPRSRLGAARHSAAIAVALRPDLDHLKGGNEVFCRLLGHARVHDGCRLTEWRSEWSAVKAFGHHVRPDGFGRWHDGDAWCEFFLEYDTGTEPQDRLVAKLRGYADLARSAGVNAPVLFWLRTSSREDNLHSTLATAQVTVPVATAFGDPAATDIAGAIWRPAFAAQATSRLALADLGAAAASWTGQPQHLHRLLE